MCIFCNTKSGDNCPIPARIYSCAICPFPEEYQVTVAYLLQHNVCDGSEPFLQKFIMALTP